MDSKQNVFKNSEDKWDFIIAIIVIIVFSLFVFLLYSINTKEKIEGVIPTELNKTQDKTTISIDGEKTNSDNLSIDKSEYQTKTNKAVISSELNEPSKNTTRINTKNNNNQEQSKTINTKNAYQDNKDSAVVNGNGIKNHSTINDAKTNTTTSIDVSEEEKTTNNSSSNSISQEELVEDTAESKSEEEKEKTKESSSLEENTSIKKGATSTNFNCIVVVGVFKENNNKIKMTDKLTSLGYSPYQGVLKKGFYYVGVPVRCSNRLEKYRLINTLNQEFGINSWIKKI